MDKELLQRVLDAFDYHVAQTRPLEKSSLAMAELHAALAQPAESTLKDAPVNHEEAKSLAYIKRQESNLARCYLDLCESAQPVQPATQPQGKP